AAWAAALRGAPPSRRHRSATPSGNGRVDTGLASGMGGTEKKHPRGAGRKPGRPWCTFLKRSRARAPRPRGRPARAVGDAPHAAPPATRLPGPASGRARDALLDKLDSLAALLPGDGWIAGQRAASVG